MRIVLAILSYSIISIHRGTRKKKKPTTPPPQNGIEANKNPHRYRQCDQPTCDRQQRLQHGGSEHLPEPTPKRRTRTEAEEAGGTSDREAADRADRPEADAAAAARAGKREETSLLHMLADSSQLDAGVRLMDLRRRSSRRVRAGWEERRPEMRKALRAAFLGPDFAAFHVSTAHLDPPPNRAGLFPRECFSEPD